MFVGSSPYANMSGREVMRLICEGYRLERPNHCKPELYRVMARTWHDNPDQRPTFTQLRTELAEMLENTTVEGSYVDLESFRADSTVYEIDNCTPRGNYFTVKSRFSEFECDI